VPVPALLAATTKPAKQRKLSLEASDMQFCRGIRLCPCYLECSLDINVVFQFLSFPYHFSLIESVLLCFMGVWVLAFFLVCVKSVCHQKITIIGVSLH
jgi:hypothetical protein